MADDVTVEISKSILLKAAGSDFLNYIGGRFFEEIAPHGTRHPYVVYDFITNNPERLFVENFERSLLQFDLYSLSTSSTEIKKIYQYKKALYDEIHGSDMPITGSTLLWMRRQNTIVTPETLSNEIGGEFVRHWSVDYEILTETD